mmetsp:Transcript_19983/g.65090  ORF Transcript_19983/g.65090 Transcript_19983/m.65090 type:complete len:218 (-) Transcript_19983:167-820(-)
MMLLSALRSAERSIAPHLAKATVVPPASAAIVALPASLPLARATGLSLAAAAGVRHITVFPSHPNVEVPNRGRFVPKSHTATPLLVRGAEPKLDLIEKFLSPQIASQMEYNKLLMLESARDVAIHDRDTGSTEVQVAQLTQRIEYMKTHMQTHKKDLSSRRGLQRMLESRQKLLRYLRGTDGERYGALIGRLGLKDSSFSESKYPARNTSGKRRRRG